MSKRKWWKHRPNGARAERIKPRKLIADPVTIVDGTTYNTLTVDDSGALHVRIDNNANTAVSVQAEDVVLNIPPISNTGLYAGMDMSDVITQLDQRLDRIETTQNSQRAQTAWPVTDVHQLIQNLENQGYYQTDIEMALGDLLRLSQSGTLMNLEMGAQNVQA